MSLGDAPILVATDFSTRSDRALRRAILIARQLGASLHLVHVVDEDQPGHLLDAQLKVARSILDECVGTLAKTDSVPAGAEVVSGDVFSRILGVADEVDAGLILIGPYRRKLRDVFTGTTAQRIVAHSRRPVLIAAGLPSGPYDRILIALGTDEASEAAAERMVLIGLMDRPEAVTLHAYDAPAQAMMKRALVEPEAIDHYVDAQGRRAEREFGAFAERLGFGEARRILAPVRGNPARTILESAREQEADLIVMGTSQKKGIRRILLGSVAADVIGEAERDVLVLPMG